MRFSLVTNHQRGADSLEWPADVVKTGDDGVGEPLEPVGARFEVVGAVI